MRGLNKKIWHKNYDIDMTIFISVSSDSWFFKSWIQICTSFLKPEYTFPFSLTKTGNMYSFFLIHDLCPASGDHKCQGFRLEKAITLLDCLQSKFIIICNLLKVPRTLRIKIKIKGQDPKLSTILAIKTTVINCVVVSRLLKPSCF